MKKTVDQINTFVQDVVARHNIPSLTLAVVDYNGTTVLQNGYGFGLLEGEIKASREGNGNKKIKGSRHLRRVY